MRFRFVVPALVLALAACVADQARMSREAVTVDAQGLTVAVHAAAPWVDTGIDVKAGEIWRLDASGRWSIGAFCGETGPDGAGVSPLCAGDSLGIGATGSTLIGRIGVSGKPFKVGNGLNLAVEAPGRLFLAAYDMIPFDNTGTIHVAVRPAGAAKLVVSGGTATAATKAASAVKATLPGDGPLVVPAFSELTDYVGYSEKALRTYPHFRLLAKMRLDARARRAEGDRHMAAGEAALRVGDNRKALASFAAAYPWLEADPATGREKESLTGMAKALGGLRAPPVFPAASFAEIEAAGRRWRGGDAVQAAEAAKAIERAVRQAPWWSGGHLELGMAREAAGQNLRAKAAYENFLVLKPSGPVVEALRARWADVEIRAADDRQVNRWKGLWVVEETWATAGAIVEAQLDGAIVNFVVLAHTEAGKTNGWKPGDIMFTGTIEGDTASGWAAARNVCEDITPRDMCRSCYGDVMWFETKLTMRRDGSGLDGRSDWYWPSRPKPGGTQCIFAKSTRKTSTHEMLRIAIAPEHM